MANDKVKIATSKLTALADAIRAKSGGSEEITLNDIPNIVPSLAAPTWADGSWDDIAEALDKHKKGEIDLYTTPGWGIGATRTVSLPVMDDLTNPGWYNSQDVEIVLTDHDGYDLADGSGKCVFTWDLKHVLTRSYMVPRYAPMNSTDTNDGGWDGCARRTWCNNTFYNALPSGFKSLIPQVMVWASAGSRSTEIITSNDYCFLRSEVEVFGLVNHSAAGEGTHIEYYKTAENRIKKAGANDASETAWWLRSPALENNTDFCSIDDGISNYVPSTIQSGIAPCGCL